MSFPEYSNSHIYAHKTMETNPVNKLRELHLFQVSAFVSLCRHLLPTIQEGWRLQRHTSHLPLNVLSYLCSHLKMEMEQVEACWSLLHAVVISEDTLIHQTLIATPSSTAESVQRLYSMNIRKWDTDKDEISIDGSFAAAIILEIDFDICPEEGCGRKLVRKPSLTGTLLTTTNGRLPISLPSKYCNSEGFNSFHW